MGFFDDVSDTVSDTVDNVSDTVDDAVDTVTDTFSGDEEDDSVQVSEDTEVETIVVDEGDSASEAADKVSQSISNSQSSSSSSGGSGGSSGSRSSGRSSSGSSSSGSSGSSGGSSSGSSSSGSSGSSGGSSSSSTDDSPGGLLESAAEEAKRREESLADPLKIDEEKTPGAGQEAPTLGEAFGPSDSPTTTDEAIRQSQFGVISQTGADVAVARGQLEEQKETIEQTPEGTEFETSEGETISRQEALQQTQTGLENVQEVSEQLTLQGTRELARAQARLENQQSDDVNLDRVQDIGLPSFNVDNPARDIIGPDRFNVDLNRGAGFIQTATSPSGGKLFGSFLDPDVSAEDVIIEEQERVLEEDVGFGESLKEGALESPPGLFLAASGAGAAFKAGTARLGASAPRAAAAVEGAALLGGAAYAGKKSSEATEEILQGDIAEGVGEFTELGAELSGFAAGSRAAASRLSPSIEGPIRLTETSQVRPRGEGDFTGKGRFEGEVRVEYPRLAERLGIGESGPRDVSGEFRVTGGSGSSEARGTARIDLGPRGTRETDFESIRIQTGEGETPSGKEFTEARDIFRTFEEGPLFRSTETRTGESRNIKEGERSVEKLITDPFSRTTIEGKTEDLPGASIRGEIERPGGVKTEDIDARAIDALTFSPKGEGFETFGESTTIVRDPFPGAGSSGGGARAGGGGGQQTGGRVEGLVEGEFVSSSLAGREFADLAAVPPGPDAGGGVIDAARDFVEGGSQAEGRTGDLGPGFEEGAGPAFDSAEAVQEEVQDPFAHHDEGLQTVPGEETVTRQGQVEEIPEEPAGVSDPFPETRPAPEEEELIRGPEPDTSIEETEDRIQDPFTEERPAEDVGLREGQDQFPVEHPIEEEVPREIQRVEPEEAQIERQEPVLAEELELLERERLRPPRLEGAGRVAPPAGPLFGGGPEGRAEGEPIFPEPGEPAEGEFQPSLEAVLFDIEDEVDEEAELTGLELRPIPEDTENPFR